MNSDHLTERPTRKIRMCSNPLALLLLAIILSASTARAEWKTETFDLVPGWNAVYLHVDPSHEDLDVLLQHTPISRVEMWAPSASSAQFVTSVQDSTTFGSSWLSWDNDPNDGVESVLQKALGNAAYLVYVENSYFDVNSTETDVTTASPFVWSLKGRVVPPTYSWTASGQNFVGFSTGTDSPPSFENFLALAPVLDSSSTEIYEYPGGDLGTSNPLLVDAPITTPVTRGKAYWVRDSDYNQYFAPIAISLQDSSGVHFGTRLSEYRLRIENEANVAQTVTLQLVASETPADDSTLIGSPPVLVRGELSSTDFTYAFANLADGSISWDLAANGEVGASVEVVLGIDRAAMTGSEGDAYGAILRFTDNFGSSGGYSQIDLPVTAAVGSLAGLWVGEAEITQVQQDLTEYEVDDDGATALDDDGSSVVSSSDDSFGGVARSYSLRLIMHMDEAGNTRLLQRIYYGLDTDSSPILATGQGLLNADHLDVARRITAVHLPWSETNTVWDFDSSLGLTSIMNTTVSVGYDDTASNPFLHIYHPDHDNRDAEFSTTPLDRGYESFDIEREITLNAGTTLVTSDSSASSSDSAEDTSADSTDVTPSLPTGVNMIDLPRGVFVMGDDAADSTDTTAPTPERAVNISAFKMSDTEITVGQYVDFLNAAGTDGMITVGADSEGTFVFGASGQPYEGLKFVELSGTRVVEDLDGDGDLDPENPLNQCWIDYDVATGLFSVGDPEAVDWTSYAYESAAAVGITRNEWTVSATLLGGTTPVVKSDGDTDEGGDETFNLQDPRQVVLTQWGTTNIAYVGCVTSDNLLVLDVTDPARIEILNELKHGVDGNELDGVTQLRIFGGLLIALDSGGNPDAVSIYDISADPTAPALQSVRYDSGTTPNMTIPVDAAVTGHHLIVSSVEDHLTIFDIRDPANPVLVNDVGTGTTDSNGNTFRFQNPPLAIEGNILCVSSGSRIQILDVSDPTDPLVLSEIEDGVSGFNKAASTAEMVLRNSILYFSAGGTDDAVTIADLTNPANPTVLAELSAADGSLPALDGPRRLVLDGHLLYVPWTGSGALTVIDVLDPTSPVLLETLTDGQTGYDKLEELIAVAVADDRIYALSRTENALTVIQPPLSAGESISDWPELTDNLPTQSEVTDWPATFVKWHGAKAFAQYYGADLPTEAQWEYSARGGLGNGYGTVDGSLFGDVANFNDAELGHVSPVKSHAANAFGLYDLTGNVAEWCRDWFNPNFYADAPDPDYDPLNADLYLGTVEPLEDAAFVGGPDEEFNGDARVRRGGSWRTDPASQAAASRDRDYTWRGRSGHGFRIVQDGSYTIEAVTATSFTALTSTSTKLSGTYQEKVTLRGRDDESKEYNIAGEFSLTRISDISELKQE